MTPTAGHRIVQQLELHGVERAYLVPGESFLEVLDGLHDSPIAPVVCRHEGGAGFMALAEARLSGRPGIAMVTRGPGAANAMIAVHTAFQDATALVLFIGLVPLADRERDAFQEFDPKGWFGSTAKRVFTLEDPARAAETVRQAMRIAASGRPGPVVVGLPEDVLRMPSAPPALRAAPPAEPLPDPESMAAVCRLLAGAERPLLVVGGDGWHGSTGRRLAEWAERARLPIAACWRAHDAVPNDAACWAGWLGYGRSDTVAAGLAEADLLCFVGAPRGDVDSDGFTLGMDAPTVLVVPDPEALGHAGRLDAQITACPRSFVAALPEPSLARGGRGREWMDALAAGQRAFCRPVADGGEGVDLGLAFEVLRDRLPTDAVLAYGAGNATLWGQRYLPHTAPNSLVGPRNGAMGLGVPAAIAASLVFPGRRTVAVCGDGDFLMNAQELAVARASGARPLILVVDNGVYGTIVQHQRREHPGRPSGTSLQNPDFAAWMHSFGGFGERVTCTQELPAALDRALAWDGPALLHLLTDPRTMGPQGFPAGAGPDGTAPEGGGTTAERDGSTETEAA
ncbi:MAG: thiamine pyrophosphate-binding protein [Pseudoclavibacter sp.]|nr:thiamine pyrophosphate-binding protein [Pseudoclavibacter sp.]